MKRTLLFACAFFVSAASLSAAPYEMVDRKNWHISFSAGGALADDTENQYDASIGGFKATSQEEWDFGIGPAAAFAVGYTWDEWRFELEYSYKRNEIKSIQTIGGNLDGFGSSLSTHSITANIAYDWFFHENWYWYNGAGLGVTIGQISYDNPISSWRRFGHGSRLPNQDRRWS